MKYLVMTIRKPTFEDSVRSEHYAFLQGLRDRGLLEQAGPFTDQTGGAYVICAASMDEARAIALEDPVHLRDCSTVTVHEWDAI
jgi:uncharacterized protein YciI